MFKPYRNESA